MYETVKTVNGYDIYRMSGTRCCYWIQINDKTRMNFKTQKAAAEWAMSKSDKEEA